LIEGDFYPGDLLCNMLKIAEPFWNAHPPLRDQLLLIANIARETTDDAELCALCSSFISR